MRRPAKSRRIVSAIFVLLTVAFMMFDGAPSHEGADHEVHTHAQSEPQASAHGDTCHGTGACHQAALKDVQFNFSIISYSARLTPLKSLNPIDDFLPEFDTPPPRT
ncbi:MAG: hypothetical protein P8N68_14165 [Paracoccaceae bacterium]|nr:hypothetical protein [Paracoccaceae bacterium]